MKSKRGKNVGLPAVRKVQTNSEALRRNIIQEDLLRRRIAADESFRKEYPNLWKQREADRLVRNGEVAALNHRLRSAGLRPVSHEPSLAPRIRKLRQLEASNRVETARIRKAR